MIKHNIEIKRIQILPRNGVHIIDCIIDEVAYEIFIRLPNSTDPGEVNYAASLRYGGNTGGCNEVDIAPEIYDQIIGELLPLYKKYRLSGESVIRPYGGSKKC